METINPDLLTTHIRTNAAARALLTRRVNEGKYSPRQASPRMRQLLAEAEALREQDMARRPNVRWWPITRPEWLVEG